MSLIPAISPKERDFLFVGPGGHFQKYRQRTVWNQCRLHRLATQYCKLSKDRAKRDFVEQFVEHVWNAGGRFLRGTTAVLVAKKTKKQQGTNNAITWLEETKSNKGQIIQDIMCILRQIGKRFIQEEDQVQNELGHMALQLEQLESAISRLRSTVNGHLYSSSVMENNRLLQESSTASLNLTKARKATKLLQDMNTRTTKLTKHLEA